MNVPLFLKKWFDLDKSIMCLIISVPFVIWGLTMYRGVLELGPTIVAHFF